MSVIGIDFGNFNSYVAIVKGGGIDTVDNSYSYRATPTCVSFTDQIRLCGNSAEGQALTNFRNSASYFKNLIGLKYDDEIAQYEMSFSHFKFVKLEDGGIGISVSYKGAQTTFTIVQLVAMMFSDLKEVALRHVSVVNDCVISVPSFFNETQRKDLLTAASVAELNPICLLNDTAATCLGYCIFKSDLPTNDQPPRIVAFVDIGYSQTQVVIASFTKNKVNILSSNGSNMIGGRCFDKVLFDKFCNEFQSKHHLDIRSNAKASLRLLKACEDLKKKTSTNSLVLPIGVDCLIDEIDFSSKCSREEMESLSASVFQNLSELMQSAINDSKIDLSQLHSVEAVGGSTRIVGVRNLICSIFKKEVSTTINADEIVARGCAIKCALVSPTVRVREVEINDLLSSSYNISYEGKNGVRKDITIFAKGQVFPSTKEAAFPATDDFSFCVNYCPPIGAPRVLANYLVHGKSFQECNGHKLVINLRIDQSCTFSVNSAFFLENKTVAVEKAVEPTPTNDTKPEGEEPNQEPKAPEVETNNKAQEVKVVKVRHDLSVEGQNVNSFTHNVQAYIETEKQMKAHIISAKERSLHKNNLEEYVYIFREKLSDALRSYVNDDEYNMAQQKLTTEEDWLYSSEGETASSSDYISRLDALISDFCEFELRYNTHTQLLESLETLSATFPKYRKLLDQFSEDPVRFEHVSNIDYTKYVEKLSQTEEFYLSSFNKLSSTPKTTIPSIKPEDVKKQSLEMSKVCDPILSKANNPPPKPVEKPINVEETK